MRLLIVWIVIRELFLNCFCIHLHKEVDDGRDFGDEFEECSSNESIAEFVELGQCLVLDILIHALQLIHYEYLQNIREVDTQSKSPDI